EVVYDPDTDLSFGVFCRRDLPANDSTGESSREQKVAGKILPTMCRCVERAWSMVTALKTKNLVRRWLLLDRILFWFRRWLHAMKARPFPVSSTYDEVIHDPKTDTYYGILYSKEEHEARKGKPVEVRIVEDDPTGQENQACTKGKEVAAERQ